MVSKLTPLEQASSTPSNTLVPNVHTRPHIATHSARRYIRPKLADLFPEKFGGSVTADDLYRAFNVVRPSLIRVEADEATYPMHIIVRYELESGLIDGSIKVGRCSGAKLGRTCRQGEWTAQGREGRKSLGATAWKHAAGQLANQPACLLSASKLTCLLLSPAEDL